MPLPKRKQPLAKFIAFHDLSQEQFAEAISEPELGIIVTKQELKTLVRGFRYPTPRELSRISAALGGLPVEVLFEPEMLAHRDAESWPPKGRGFRTNRSA